MDPPHRQFAGMTRQIAGSDLIVCTSLTSFVAEYINHLSCHHEVTCTTVGRWAWGRVSAMPARPVYQ